MGPILAGARTIWPAPCVLLSPQHMFNSNADLPLLRLSSGPRFQRGSNSQRTGVAGNRVQRSHQGGTVIGHDDFACGVSHRPLTPEMLSVVMQNRC